MKYLEWTLPTVAENLACDEALLASAERDGLGGILRLWEPRDRAVVVGYGNRVAREVNRDACRQRGVPVLRRVSGGGAVFQGPGCLDYTLVLPFSAAPALESISSTNRFILERHRAALQTLVGGRLALAGHTDLARDGMKFSGNAQRRGRTHVLFHGTFLLALDLETVASLLPFPSRPPEYRRGRGHREFLANLGVPAAAIRAALAEAWAAQPSTLPPLGADIARCVEQRYGRDAWNLRL